MAFGFWGFTFFTFGPLAAGLKDFCVASRSGAARLRRRPPVVAAVIESGCAAACWAAKSGWTRRSARRPELRCGEGLGGGSVGAGRVGGARYDLGWPNGAGEGSVPGASCAPDASSARSRAWMDGPVATFPTFRSVSVR